MNEIRCFRAIEGNSPHTHSAERKCMKKRTLQETNGEMWRKQQPQYRDVHKSRSDASEPIKVAFHTDQTVKRGRKRTEVQFKAAIQQCISFRPRGHFTLHSRERKNTTFLLHLLHTFLRNKLSLFIFRCARIYFIPAIACKSPHCSDFVIT